MVEMASSSFSLLLQGTGHERLAASRTCGDSACYLVFCSGSLPVCLMAYNTFEVCCLLMLCCVVCCEGASSSIQMAGQSQRLQEGLEMRFACLKYLFAWCFWMLPEALVSRPAILSEVCLSPDGSVGFIRRCSLRSCAPLYAYTCMPRWPPAGICTRPIDRDFRRGEASGGAQDKGMAVTKKA
eukprot:1158410-Pelagomonas_calceolata.AAC.13